MLRLARFLRTALLATFGMLAGAVASRAAPAGELAFTIDLPAGRSLADIGNTLVVISSARTWNIKERADDRLVIQLVHRKVDATVTYLISEQKILAYCEGYQVDGNGKRGKPEQPARWLKYLQEDIRRLLVTAPVPLVPTTAPTTKPPVATTPPPAPAPAAPAPPSTLPPRPGAGAGDPAKNDVFPPAVAATAPTPPGPPAPRVESAQLVQFPTEAVSPLSYYARVYVLRPRGPIAGDTPVRIFDESPGAQGSGPGRAVELGSLDEDRMLAWNRPPGVLSLRADTGSRVTPRLPLELAASKTYYVVVQGSGVTTRFTPLAEPEGAPLLAVCRPTFVATDAPDSLDAYLVAAASDGRTEAVKKFLSSDRNRSYEQALAASIDQAQPQVTNMLVKAGATLPTATTPDARFRLGAVQKALADMFAEEGKTSEAKKYYEQAMALFAAVKPELAAAAETKFKAASERSGGKESFWSTVAQTAAKAMASGAAGGSAAGAGGGNQAAFAQLLAMKDAGSFAELFTKLKGASPANASGATPGAANKEIPKELVALLDSMTNKAVLDKTLSERCDLLVAEIQKKLATPN